MNGTWTGSLGMILNGSVDTTCILYQSTPLRQQSFDYTNPVFYVGDVGTKVNEKQRPGDGPADQFRANRVSCRRTP